MLSEGQRRFEFEMADHHEAEAWAFALGWRLVVASADDGTEWIGIKPEFADENLFQIYREASGLVGVLRAPDWDDAVCFVDVREALASIRLLDVIQRAVAAAYWPAWRRPII